MDWKLYLWMFAVTSSLAGVQFVYSLQFAVGTSFFSDNFQVPATTANIILSTSGPISGFLVQPIVGVLSDNARFTWGRRRPYILGGTILTALGMALLAVSPKLGVACGDTDTHHHWGVTWAVLGLWIMNLFANVMQGPSRALVNDVVEPEYLQTANSFVSAVMALAAVIGGIIAALTTKLEDSYFYLLLAGAGCIVVVCIPTLIFAKEIPLVVEDGKPRKTILGVFADIIQGFRIMPRYLFLVAMLYFWSWCAYTPQMVNQTNYVRINLYGDTTGAGDGLKVAYYVSSIFAIVQFCWSMIQPFFTKRLGVRVIYLTTQLLATVCYIAILFTTSHVGLSIFLLVLVALNFSAFNSIPFALVAKYTAGESGGLMMGVLNSAAVLSQVLSINAVAAPVLHAKDDNAAYAIAVAGTIFSGIAFLWGFALVREQTGHKEEEKTRLINTYTMVLDSFNDSHTAPPVHKHRHEHP